MSAGKIERIAGRGLRITALEIKNLWGVAEASIRPGQRNIIRGANASGKTSVLSAIQLALGGGTLGKYQRIGARENEPPEIVLEISGPNDFIRIEREGDKPPKVLRRVGGSEALEKVPAPATFLKGLFDVKGANPFEFLGASDDDRAQLLLEALDVRMDEEGLLNALGEDVKLADAIPSHLHPLIRLALIHDAVYSARRGCNVDAEGKTKAAEQLKRSVPHERIPDVAGEIVAVEQIVIAEAERLAREEEAHDAELARERESAIRAVEEEETRLAGALVSEAAAARADLDRWAAEKRAELEREISAREREMVEASEMRRHTFEDEVKRLNGAAREKKLNAEGRREYSRMAELAARAVLAARRERLAGLRAQQAEVARHENTRAQIATFEEAAKRHQQDADRLSKKLRGLEDLKRQLAENLPIEGLDISGKEILVNNIPWRDLNKAQQGSIAALVALERAKRSRLPVIFFDEAEQFDMAHIDAIAKVIEEAGAQFFAAVVAREGEISIEADGVETGCVRVVAPPDPVVSR